MVDNNNGGYYSSNEEMISDYKNNYKNFKKNVFNKVVKMGDFKGIDIIKYKDYIDFEVVDFKPLEEPTGRAVGELHVRLKYVSKKFTRESFINFEYKYISDKNLDSVDKIERYVTVGDRLPINYDLYSEGLRGDKGKYEWSEWNITQYDALGFMVLGETFMRVLKERGYVSDDNFYNHNTNKTIDVGLKQGGYYLNLTVKTDKGDMNLGYNIDKLGVLFKKDVKKSVSESDGVILNKEKEKDKEFKQEINYKKFTRNYIEDYEDLVNDIGIRINNYIDYYENLVNIEVGTNREEKIASRVKEINSEEKSLERLKRVSIAFNSEGRIKFKLYEDRNFGKVILVSLRSGTFIFSHGIVYDVGRSTIISDRVGKVNLFDNLQINEYFKALVHELPVAREEIYELNYIVMSYVFFSNLKRALNNDNIEMVKHRATELSKPR